MAFTGDLTVSEFTLAVEAGLRPVRLVGGAGVFSLPPPVRYGGGYLGPGQAARMGLQEDDWNSARDTVLGRMRDEAQLCGAHVVIGVSLRRQTPRRVLLAGQQNWDQEFTALGTAFTRSESRGGGPVLTNLRVQDYWKLIQHDCAPVGLVTATGAAIARSAWDVDPPGVPRYAAGAKSGQQQTRIDRHGLQDRPELHAIARQAYSTALEKLRADAARLGATGIAAVEIERSHAEWSPSESAQYFTVSVHAIGTAVTDSESGSEQRAPLTIMPIRHLGR